MDPMIEFNIGGSLMIGIAKLTMYWA